MKPPSNSETRAAVGYGVAGIGVRVNGSLFRETWKQMELQDNDGYGAGLEFTFADAPWVTPTIGGSFTYTEYRNEAAFFGIERLDRKYEGLIEFKLRDVDLFGTGAPVLRYRYKHATSNIPLFEYDAHEFTVGVKAIVF